MKKQMTIIASCVQQDRESVRSNPAHVGCSALLILLFLVSLTACASKKVPLEPDPEPPAFSEVPTEEQRHRLQDKRKRLQENIKMSGWDRALNQTTVP